jgi:hypothetical protein
MQLTSVSYQVLDLKVVPCALLNTLSVANIADNGVSMEHWQNILTGETEVLGENPVSMPLFPLQMSFAMALD